MDRPITPTGDDGQWGTIPLPLIDLFREAVNEDVSPALLRLSVELTYQWSKLRTVPADELRARCLQLIDVMGGDWKIQELHGHRGQRQTGGGSPKGRRKSPAWKRSMRKHWRGGESD